MVAVLCEAEGDVCVQAIPAQRAAGAPGTAERREKEKERPTSPPKTLCSLAMQVSG